MRLLLCIACLCLFAQETSAQRLPEWTPPTKGQLIDFNIDAAGPRLRRWGASDLPTPFYPEEFLPGLFQRTLLLDDVDFADGKLQWIFTGPHGGLTVVADGDSVELVMRYYDSVGYNLVNGGKPGRYTEWRAKPATTRYEGKLRAITVAMDHKLGVSVALNGRVWHHKTCPLDLTRHQLRFTGSRGHLRGRLHMPEPEATTVEMDTSQRHQKIIGFGGIATPTAYAQLSPEGRQQWWRLVVEFNLLIQREYPMGVQLNRGMDNADRLSDASPHYYGDNFPNGEVSDFDYLKKIRRLGGEIWFEFWKLPPWAVRTDSQGKSRPIIEQYVRAMVGYCRTCQERTGAPPDVVGIQNEVHQPTDVWHAMTLALRRGLDEAGFKDVRIHMSDSGTLVDGIRRAEAFRSNEKVWDTIDYSATHMYDYQRCFTDPDRYDSHLKKWKEVARGKPFLSTELCVNSGAYQWPGYRLAFSMGQLYHKNLVMVDASALCYCWTLLNVVQPSFGWTRTLMVPDPAEGFLPVASSHQLRVFGAFSRRIRRDMVRVATKTSSDDLLTSAYEDADGHRTVVLLNRSIRPREIRLRWSDATFEQLEQVDPYSPNRVLPAPKPAKDGTLRWTIPPGAIHTLTSAPLGSLPESETGQ